MVRIGTAQADITPELPVLMGGGGSKPAEKNRYEDRFLLGLFLKHRLTKKTLEG